MANHTLYHPYIQNPHLSLPFTPWIPRFDLKELWLFHRLADLGSIQELALSEAEPVIPARLKNRIYLLEQSLTVPLFRQGRGHRYVPTSYGERLYQSSCIILNEAMNAEDELALMKKAEA